MVKRIEEAVKDLEGYFNYNDSKVVEEIKDKRLKRVKTYHYKCREGIIELELYEDGKGNKYALLVNPATAGYRWYNKDNLQTAFAHAKELKMRYNYLAGFYTE